jgi:hypothetical protein
LKRIKKEWCWRDNDVQILFCNQSLYHHNSSSILTLVTMATQRYQLNVWFNTFDKSIAVEQTHIFTADFSLLYECDMFY